MANREKSARRRIGSWTARILACAALAACSDFVPETPTVAVTRALRGTVEITRLADARARSPQSVEIRARVPGYLLERAVVDGADVEQNQLLFRIQPDAHQAELDRAKAALARDQAALEQARKADEVQKSEQSSLRLRELEAAVAADEAAVRQAEIALSYATILSPIDGRIGQHQVDVGNLVGQGEPTLLATVEQLDPIHVEFEIAAVDLPMLLEAQRHAPPEVEILLPDGRPHPQRGRVDFVANDLGPEETIAVRAVVPNPERALRAGEPLQAHLLLGSRQDVVAVPTTAVRAQEGRATVLVVGPDSWVERREVVLGQAGRGLQIIESGLAEDEIVVIAGDLPLEPGTRVETLIQPIEGEQRTDPASKGTP